MESKMIVILDLLTYLRPDVSDLEALKASLSYYVKGTTVRIDKRKAQDLREVLKDNPKLVLIHNPNMYRKKIQDPEKEIFLNSKISVLDLKQIMDTFSIPKTRIDMVDTSLFNGEEECAPIFRAEEYLIYHSKSNDVIREVLLQVDPDYKIKKDYYELRDTTKRFITSGLEIGDGELLSVSLTR